jgi:hypothetical protein
MVWIRKEDTAARDFLVTSSDGSQQVNRAIVGYHAIRPTLRERRLRNHQVRHGYPCLLQNIQVVQKNVGVTYYQSRRLARLQERKQFFGGFDDARLSNHCFYNPPLGCILVHKVTSETEIVSEIPFADGLDDFPSFARLSKERWSSIQGRRSGDFFDIFFHSRTVFSFIHI